MTVISLHSRIHFAEDVLEEALCGEAADVAPRGTLVVCEQFLTQTDLGERVLNSLPPQFRIDLLTIAPDQDKYATAAEAAATVDPETCDLIVVFGSAHAIAHARKCRNEIARRRHAALAPSQRRTTSLSRLLPEFFVVPGIDGLPDPCRSPAAATESSKFAPPTVMICDPTVIEGAHGRDLSRVFAKTLGLCLGVLALPGFNPFADGLAIEGLRRLWAAGPYEDMGRRTETRRDLMAAGLNAGVASQKGQSLIQGVSVALEAATGRRFDSGTLHRILLPAAMRAAESAPRPHDAIVRRILGVPERESIGRSLDALFDRLPLERALHQLDIDRAALAEVVARLHGDPMPLDARPEGIERILEAAY